MLLVGKNYVFIFFAEVYNECLHFEFVSNLLHTVRARSLSDIFGKFESEVRAACRALTDKHFAYYGSSDEKDSVDDLFGSDTEDRAHDEKSYLLCRIPMAKI